MASRRNSTFDPSALSGISAGTGTGRGQDSGNSFEDSVAFPDSLALDSLDEEPFNITANWDEDSPPYDGGLYSTPLSWEPPLPVPKAEETVSTAPFTMNVLTPAQQEKLRSIAMPQHLQYNNQNSPNSTASYKSNSISSPDNNDSHGRKRKSSTEAEDEDDEDSGDHPPVKKTAHNMIEKRYRTNLNDKIAALRDSVPSLRIMQKSARGEDTAGDREELQGLTPAHKLNKATVLSKATEYIRHLEKRNNKLIQENDTMKIRISAFEKLFVSGSMGFAPAQQQVQAYPYQDNVYTPGPSPTAEPQGMIPVPDDIRRMHGQMSQQIYQVPQEYHPQARQPVGPTGWQNGGGYFGKLMVGSLAGLMILEGFSESEQQTNTPNARGLGAIPAQFFRFLHSMFDLQFSGYHIPASEIFGFLKFCLVAGLLIYFFLPSLYKVKSKAKAVEAPSQSLAAAPSLASSIAVRRQAWLTAVQTVWVPQHDFFLEAFALILKSIKFTVFNTTGRGIPFFSGTAEQEAARIKAWTIALDAQLAGGDIDISKSRLTLTLLASGTLPDTPARLMLKSLHIRVLLWELGNAGWRSVIAARLARWKWNEARRLQKLYTHLEEHKDDLVPEHLATLLEQECDDVLVDCIGQRAYNLARNLPTTDNTEADDGMDAVVEDFAIRSPLDAVAAWWSSLTLHKVLARSLEVDAEAKEIIEDLGLAIKTAPVGSGAQVRALAARAFLVKENRGASIGATMKAIGPLGKTASTLINASTPSVPDTQLSLRCAMAIAYIDRHPMPEHPDDVYKCINSIEAANLTLLGFTALFKLLERMNGHPSVATNSARKLEEFSGALRIWIGGKEGEKSGLETELKQDIVERCLAINKQVVGMVERDAGYESMTEDDEGC